ncbi:MAG: hypothetical protein EPO65_00915 [Dehalococcoidia bacterium]|nr:MAG: hypothetical protein EPO65_00915 [Dehalococcoidia bacterium]
MTAGEICGICNEVEEAPLVECIRCSTKFHLALFKDRPGKDCGDAILGESMGVEMLCNNCIELERAGSDAGANLLGLYNAMTEGRLPPPMAPADTAAPRPARPAPESTSDRPRRRFRRIDR